MIDQLNRYFIKTTERTLGTLSDKATDLVDLIDSPPEPDRYPFQLRTVSTEEVLKEISLFRSDCYTGIDQIPVKYVEQVGDFLTGPLAHIINVCISNRTQTIDRSLYFPRFPRSSSVWCSSNSSTLLMNNLYYSQASRASGRTVHHNWFAPYLGRSYSGHEEAWGHRDVHGRLFEGIWYRKV